jgi:hypothetical protein
MLKFFNPDGSLLRYAVIMYDATNIRVVIESGCVVQIFEPWPIAVSCYPRIFIC